MQIYIKNNIKNIFFICTLVINLNLKHSNMKQKPSIKNQLIQVIKENEVAIIIAITLLLLILVGQVQQSTPEMR